MTTKGSADVPSPAREQYLELAVPIIAFGITGTGILLWGAGYPVDFQYVSIGCTISSFILAYLAWIRPRKDIVALSTPIYGIVFLAAPIEAAAGAVLQLLYAAGLTVLLFRLKRRFSADLSGPEALSPDEPLGRYRNRLSADIPAVSPEIARAAARVFIRFAEGDYDESVRLASGVKEMHEEALPDVLERAFAIVSNHANRISENKPVPEVYPTFSADQQYLLFSPAGDIPDKDQLYNLQLENALILLYVIGIGSTDNEIQLILDQLRPFARRLSED